MRERERVVVTGVLSVLLIAWLGFLVHSDPRFAGSGVGAVFGIAGAVLMLIPLAYPIVKRVPFLHARVTARVSMQTLLTVHVYAGIFGPLLAIIHTGHKYDSWLGVSLTASMLLVVVSGFAVRYLLTYVAHDIKDKLVLLQTARGDLDSAWGNSPAAAITGIAESVADLEYAIRMDEFFKLWFARSLKLHIVVSVSFYLLLALHVVSGIYFGLRWLQ